MREMYLHIFKTL